MLNTHHLELFYYVAKHRGINAAVKRIPYGIQQPAVSSQILQLEDHLGGALFHRRPFELTPMGETLYEFIRPFFGELANIEEKLRTGANEVFRLACPRTVLRDYLPPALAALRQSRPGMRFLLREGLQSQIEDWFHRRELDFAVAIQEGGLPAGIQTEALLTLPLALVASKKRKLADADALFQSRRVAETLISLPPDDPVTRSFLRWLAKKKIEWRPGIEVNSLELVDSYAAEDFGIGLTVDLPNSPRNPGLRVRPLADGPSIQVGAMWCGRLTEPGQKLLNLLRAVAERLERARDQSAS